MIFHILRSRGPEKAALMSYFAHKHALLLGVNALGVNTTVLLVARLLTTVYAVRSTTPEAELSAASA